jgi:hypothetical protein
VAFSGAVLRHVCDFLKKAGIADITIRFNTESIGNGLDPVHATVDTGDVEVTFLLMPMRA